METAIRSLFPSESQTRAHTHTHTHNCTCQKHTRHVPRDTDYILTLMCRYTHTHTHTPHCTYTPHTGTHGWKKLFFFAAAARAPLALLPTDETSCHGRDDLVCPLFLERFVLRPVRLVHQKHHSAKLQTIFTNAWQRTHTHTHRRHTHTHRV